MSYLILVAIIIFLGYNLIIEMFLKANIMSQPTGLKLSYSLTKINSHFNGEMTCQEFEFSGVDSGYILEMVEGKTNIDFDVLSFEEIKEGDTVHVIYVNYSTGSSFGWHSRNEIEFIYATKDEEIANLIVSEIDSKNSYVTLPDGNQVYLSKCWDNDFEALDTCGFSTIVVS